MLVSRIQEALYFGNAFMISLLSKTYGTLELPGSEFSRNYVHDMALPVMSYYFGKFFFESTLKGTRLGCPLFCPALYSSLAFGICSAGELAQKFGEYHGTFDFWDFGAYAAGTGIALTLDKLAFKENKEKRLKDFFLGK